jgi:hypothetical protein
MNQAIRALSVLLIAVTALLARPAHAAGDFKTDLRSLLSADSAEVELAVERIAARHDGPSVKVLSALLDGTLRVDADGLPYISADRGGVSPLTPGSSEKPTGSLGSPVVDNQLRRKLQPILASLKLTASDRDIRLAAADDLSKRRDDDLAPPVRKALAQEKDGKVREKLALALAMVIKRSVRRPNDQPQSAGALARRTSRRQ